MCHAKAWLDPTRLRFARSHAEKRKSRSGDARVSEADDSFGGICDRPGESNSKARPLVPFRLHVPNHNDVSPRVFGSASRQTSWLPRPDQCMARRGFQRIGWVLKKAALEQSASDAARRLFLPWAWSGRLTNQARLDDRDRTSTNRPVAGEPRSGIAGAPFGDLSSSIPSVPVRCSPESSGSRPS